MELKVGVIVDVIVDNKCQKAAYKLVGKGKSVVLVVSNPIRINSLVIHQDHANLIMRSVKIGVYEHLMMPAPAKFFVYYPKVQRSEDWLESVFLSVLAGETNLMSTDFRIMSPGQSMRVTFENGN